MRDYHLVGPIIAALRADLHRDKYNDEPHYDPIKSGKKKDSLENGCFEDILDREIERIRIEEVHADVTTPEELRSALKLYNSIRPDNSTKVIILQKTRNPQYDTRTPANIIDLSGYLGKKDPETDK